MTLAHRREEATLLRADSDHLRLLFGTQRVYKTDTTGTVLAYTGDMVLPPGFKVKLKPVLEAVGPEPMPYVMIVHQAPTDGQAHPESHLHIELYPFYRMRGRLKYLAGAELGGGMFTADTYPEDKAAELGNVEVAID